MTWRITADVESAGTAGVADGMNLCVTSASAREGLARSRSWNCGRKKNEFLRFLMI